MGVGVIDDKFTDDTQEIVAGIFYNEITKRINSL